MGLRLGLVFPVFILALLASTATAQLNNSDITEQLATFEKIREYNNSVAESTLRDVSFLIAFLGGILSFIAPCTVALLPAFLANAARNKQNVSVSTLVFFSGFSLAFIALGIALTFLGKVSFVAFQQDSLGLVIQLAGFALVVFGVLSFFGKGFTLVRVSNKLPKGVFGTFLFGLLFAVGWSACVGPIIAGIFTMAAVFHNYLYTSLLLFFYSLGIAMPLFIGAALFDRFNIASSRLVQGFLLNIQLGKKRLVLSSNNMVSGALLAVLGIFFILDRGTGAITAADLFGKILLVAVLLLLGLVFYFLVVARVFHAGKTRLIFAFADAIFCLSLFFIATRHYSLRTTGLAEGFSRSVLSNVGRFNPVAAVILIFIIVLVSYFVISRPGAKAKV